MKHIHDYPLPFFRTKNVFSGCHGDFMVSSDAVIEGAIVAFVF